MASICLDHFRHDVDADLDLKAIARTAPAVGGRNSGDHADILHRHGRHETLRDVTGSSP